MIFKTLSERFFNLMLLLEYILLTAFPEVVINMYINIIKTTSKIVKIKSFTTMDYEN